MLTLKMIQHIPCHGAYLNALNNGCFNPLCSASYVGSLHVKKLEKDLFGNTYSLMCKDETECGRLFFRTNDMPISLPMMSENGLFLTNDSYSSDAVIAQLHSLSENCYDFGVVNDLMWMFGKDLSEAKKYDLKYKLVSFKFKFECNHIVVDKDSLIYYANDLSDNSLYYRNEFVGTIYDKESDELHFLTVDLEKLIKDASADLSAKYADYSEDDIVSSCLNDVDIKIMKHQLDIDKNKTMENTVKVSKCVMPMLLSHAHFFDGDRNASYEADHSIWKTEILNNKSYICYESLNIDYSRFNDFKYYLIQNPNFVIFDVLEITFNESRFFADSSYDSRNILKQTSYINFSIKKSAEKVFFNEESLLTCIRRLFDKYPKCIIRNDKLVVQVLPFTLFDDNLREERFVEKYCDNLRRLIKQHQNPAFGLQNESISFDNFIKSNLKKLIDSSSYENEYDAAERALDFIGAIEGDSSIYRQKIDEYGAIRYSRSFAASFENANSLFYALPFITQCMTEKMKIIVWFKNETGITFLNDGALDLDLTCYIDDEVEKNNPIGYYNPYLKTRFLEWSGDATLGDFEAIDVDVSKYFKERKRNTEINTKLKIDLGLCWHDTSEIKTSEVYVTLNWNHITENIPIDIIGLSNKECKTRSLEITVDSKTNELTYEKPEYYPVIKITYKDAIVGFEDGVPDVQFGLINLTKSELKELKDNGWYEAYADIEDDSVTKFYSMKNRNRFFNNRVNEYNFATFIIEEPFVISPFTFRSDITDFLSRYISISNNRLNYRTKDRFGKTGFERICMSDILFEEDLANIDPETNCKMIYYAYLKPSYFKGAEGNEEFPIEFALEDSMMNYSMIRV